MHEVSTSDLLIAGGLLVGLGMLVYLVTQQSPPSVSASYQAPMPMSPGSPPPLVPPPGIMAPL